MPNSQLLNYQLRGLLLFMDAAHQTGMLGDVDFDLMTAGLVSDGTVTAYFTHQAEGVSGVTTLLYLDVTSGTFQLGWNYAPGGTGGWTSEACPERSRRATASSPRGRKNPHRWAWT